MSRYSETTCIIYKRPNSLTISWIRLAVLVVKNTLRDYSEKQHHNEYGEELFKQVPPKFRSSVSSAHLDVGIFLGH